MAATKGERRLIFDISTKNNLTTITLTKGDSAVIETNPFIDNNNNNNLDDGDTSIQLGDNDYVVFTLAWPANQIWLKKILTKDNTTEAGTLLMSLVPQDTLALPPALYNFSFAYMPNGGQECYTYASGAFKLLPALSTVQNLEGAEPDGD